MFHGRKTSQIMNCATRLVAGAVLVMGLAKPGLATAQDHSHYNQYSQSVRIERLDAGSQIPIRLTETINVSQPDDRMFTGVVDRDVFADDGRLVIPEGEPARLIVTVGPFDNLVLHLQSVNVNGQPYFVRTDRNWIEYQPAGTSMGAVTGSEARGPALRLPSYTVLSFSLDRPLEVATN